MNTITFYGAPWCAPCHQLQRGLDDKKIAYTFLNVDKQEHQDAMLEASGGRYLIPTVVVGEKVFQNPTLAMVETALKEQETS